AAAVPRVGREPRPLQQRGPRDRGDAAQETRRPTGHPDRHRGWLPAVKGVRIGLRGRMTLLYGTLFLLSCSLVVGVTYFFTVRAVNAKFHASFPPTEPPPGTPTRTFGTVQGAVNQQLAAHRREI